MVIVELQQPNYNATIEAIAQAVLASLRTGAATDKLLAVAVEMSAKLTTHIEAFERLANDAGGRGDKAARPHHSGARSTIRNTRLLLCGLQACRNITGTSSQVA